MQSETAWLECSVPVDEAYQVARSLLGSVAAAEQAVVETFGRVARSAVGAGMREGFYAELMRQVGRRRLWGRLLQVPVRRWLGLETTRPDAVLDFVRSLRSPLAEILVLADVCDFDCPALGRILHLATGECATQLTMARERLDASLCGRPAWNHLARPPASLFHAAVEMARPAGRISTPALGSVASFRVSKTSSTALRNNSATLQACAMQPRGRCG